MDYAQHGYPGAEVTGPATGHPGCGCSNSPGPTPSPYPPSPMMPAPSIQSGGFGGSPGGMPGTTGPTQSGSHQSYAGYAHYAPGPDQLGGGPPGSPHLGASQSAHMHHPPLHDSHHYGYYPYDPAPQYATPSTDAYSILGLNLSDGNFWKGALIGAAVTLLVTSETVQKAIMKGVVTAYSAAQEAVGELKEKFEDAQAERRQTKE